ncbi:MAG: dUTP diphosphatase [Nanoarchaeota archaeon]|nr:dUTP diphosphatase [Nanoarchaeota archaeon]
MKVKIQKSRPDAIIPKYSHVGDAGFDLYACEDIVLNSFERALVPTGIRLAIPEGHVGLIWDKSGLASKNGLKTMGGVVDSGYRGEIGILVKNLGKDPIQIKKQTKVAQMLIQPIVRVDFEETDLDDTARGERGFGSTGLE